ncbi:pentapeptide repeat-containing protein [Micromonospora chalcea]|uniref:pentapeptide repeat-containing protein n=1 Tax=Micromonospora chalcea TaxID=1874 RepID=UPI0037209E2C
MTRGRISQVLRAVGAATLVAAVLVQSRPWGSRWREFVEATGRYPAVALSVLGVLLLLVSMWLRRGVRDTAVTQMNEAPRLRWPWLLSDVGVATAVALVATVGIAELITMWSIAGGAAPAERAKLQIDALKYGLGFFAAAGAVAALLLAVRRQRLSEHTHELALESQRLSERNYELAREVQSHNQVDAAERRVTDLYAKAADQLGSEHAPVRLAAIYALERLGAANPDQRVAIMAVFCAYLRMPFDPPGKIPLVGPPTLASRRSVGQHAAENPALAISIAKDPLEEQKREQELEVRMALQRVIARRFSTGRKGDGKIAARAWSKQDSPLSIDLSGATLVQWTMSDAIVGNADFSRVRFFGNTVFEGTNFLAFTSFRDSHFRGLAWFTGAKFHDRAVFNDSHFEWPGQFSDVEFRRRAFFNNARFISTANFQNTRADDDFDFKESEFHGPFAFDGFQASGKANGEGAKVFLSNAKAASKLPDGWLLGPRDDNTGWASIVRDQNQKPVKATGASKPKS